MLIGVHRSSCLLSDDQQVWVWAETRNAQREEDPTEVSMIVRDITKSALSLSWAFSLLGVSQAINLVRPGETSRVNRFAQMSQVAADQIDESMKGVYRSGENLQSCMVDAVFSWMNPASWTNLGNSANPMNLIRSVMSAAQSGAGCCGQSAGPAQQQPFPPGPSAQ